MTVAWDLGSSFSESEVWYGWFSAGSTSTLKDDIVKMDVNLYKTGQVGPTVVNLYLPLVLKPEISIL